MPKVTTEDAALEIYEAICVLIDEHLTIGTFFPSEEDYHLSFYLDKKSLKKLVKRINNGRK